MLFRSLSEECPIFDKTPDGEDRTLLRELHGVGEIASLDERVSRDEVLLGVGAVRRRLLGAPSDLARPVEGSPAVLEVALLAELLQPGHPALHLLLHLLRRRRSLAATVEKHVFAHGNHLSRPARNPAGQRLGPFSASTFGRPPPGQLFFLGQERYASPNPRAVTMVLASRRDAKVSRRRPRLPGSVLHDAPGALPSLGRAGSAAGDPLHHVLRL